MDNLFIRNQCLWGPQGDWVNENSATQPTSASGINRLEAEKIGKDCRIKIIILFKFLD